MDGRRASLDETCAAWADDTTAWRVVVALNKFSHAAR